MIDKDKLLGPRADTATGLPEDEVEIAGVGVVRVRGLSRDEVFRTQGGKTTQAVERAILALGMVDPQLTEADAGRWQLSSPAGEIEPVVDRIRQLSGLDENAERDAMAGFRDEPGDGVRALPGPAAGHDSGPAAGDDGPA